MLTLLTTSYVLLTTGLGLFQSVYVFLYARFLKQGGRLLQERTGEKAAERKNEQPRVAVILCLRGLDPSLERCINAIVKQNYSRYELHLVFDSVEDCSVDIAKRLLPSHRLPEVPVFHFIDHSRFSEGSLKCHALVTAVDAIAKRDPDSMGSEVEVVALVDADCIVDPNWLRDLVAPFDKSDVVATTGNRWFEPDANSSQSGLGAQVRMIWNAAAVVQMYLYTIPWGGSLAIRIRSLLADDSVSSQQASLLQKWETAFCEDTMIAAHFKKRDADGNGKHRVVRVPHLIVENQETTSLSSAFGWIMRQLLTVRLYHSGWPFVLLHALTVAVCIAALPVLLFAAVAIGDIRTAVVVATAGAGYQLLNYFLIQTIATGNRRILARRRNESVEPSSQIGISPLAVVLAQLVQPGAAVGAWIKRTVRWRGIKYRIMGNRVQMDEYKKWRDAPAEDIDVSETSVQ